MGRAIAGTRLFAVWVAGLLSFAGCAQRVPPRPCSSPLPAQVERPRFEGDSAFALIRQQVAFGPRVPGQPGHRRQLEWMHRYLTERADVVARQPFVHVTRRGGDTLRLTNLFARFRPELGNRVLLVAHWDTRPRADRARNRAERNLPIPGANDGASGTAVLLQLAESFRKQPPPVGVDLLLVDGEDFGPGARDMLLGARHFSRHLPPGYRPRYGVLVDMVADRLPYFPIERYSRRHAPEVVDRVWSVAEQLGYGCVFPRRRGRFVADDHLPLNRAGIRTINIIDFNYGPDNGFWHTPHDDVKNTSPAGLYVVGEVLSELIYRGG